MPSEVVFGLREHGFASLEGLDDSSDLVRLAEAFAVIVPHRDSDRNGLTTITDRGEPAGEGYRGVHCARA